MESMLESESIYSYTRVHIYLVWTVGCFGSNNEQHLAAADMRRDNYYALHRPCDRQIKWRRICGFIYLGSVGLGHDQQRYCERRSSVAFGLVFGKGSRGHRLDSDDISEEQLPFTTFIRINWWALTMVESSMYNVFNTCHTQVLQLKLTEYGFVSGINHHLMLSLTCLGLHMQSILCLASQLRALQSGRWRTIESIMPSSSSTK